MPDIMKFIVGGGPTDNDPSGNLQMLGDWSESIARQTAAELGLELKPEHWEVVNFLRDYYAQHGPSTHARPLLHALEDRFAKKGARKYLYTLFPGGVVTQASKIAGLPVPADSVDRSFGTTM